MADAEPIAPDERSLSFGTRALHADDVVAIREAGLAPAIGVSTTFRRPEPDSLSSPFDLGGPESNPAWHVYSRYTSPNLTRVEAVLSNLLGGCALTFGSGLAVREGRSERVETSGHPRGSDALDPARHRDHRWLRGHACHDRALLPRT